MEHDIFYNYWSFHYIILEIYGYNAALFLGE